MAMMERVRDLRVLAIMTGLFLVGGCYQTEDILTGGQVQEDDGGPPGSN